MKHIDGYVPGLLDEILKELHVESIKEGEAISFAKDWYNGRTPSVTVNYVVDGPNKLITCDYEFDDPGWNPKTIVAAANRKLALFTDLGYNGILAEIQNEEARHRHVMNNLYERRTRLEQEILGEEANA